jgi:hypothetical protein
MTNQYFNHQELIKRFKLLAMKQIPGLRIFDRTVGLFYAKRINNGIINYVPIKINSNGMADAYGLLKTQSGIIHLEFEFKTGKATQTKEQKNWEAFVKNMNGFFLVVRDENQAVTQIKNYFGV